MSGSGEAEHDTDTVSSNAAAGQCEMIREGEIRQIQAGEVSQTAENQQFFKSRCFGFVYESLCRPYLLPLDPVLTPTSALIN